MKKIIGALLIWLGAGGGAVLLAEPAAASKPAESFFIKAGAGSFLSQIFFTRYNRPDGLNGVSAQQDETITGVSGFTDSVAAGIDCPDHFSYFLSGEWLTEDRSIMADAQYTFTKLNPIKPYLYFGLGLDFSNHNAIGGAAQLGLGTQFALTQNLDIYVETKLYVSNVYWDSAQNPSTDFVRWAGYIPVLTGLKWSPSGRTEEPPTGANVPGHPFVEIAGGFDTPARNWQAAYTPAGGWKLSAGYEFESGLVVQVDFENFDFLGTNYVGPVSDNEFLVLPAVHYFLANGVMRPYLLAGVGAEFESSRSPTGYSAVADLDVALGAGIEVPLARQTSLMVEGKYNFVFADGVIGQDIPVFGGMRVGL